MEATNLTTVRKGKISGQEFFWDHAEALDALGLAEYAMSQALALVPSQPFKAGDQRLPASR